jgi:hypothetical protein
MAGAILKFRIRTVVARILPIGLAVLLAAPPLPRAQQPGSPGSSPFKPEELEQIVAPIALYPDSLIAQIMMASTYPLEVIQAARFAKDNPKLKDTALNDELKKQPWDDSVKALVSFPQVLEMMDSQLEWMQKLGDAVLAQQKATMDAIQRLRAKAQTAGNLKTTEQQKVLVDPAQPPQQQTIIRIEPADPQVIYVPTYNPEIVYGPWPYPYYPPYYYYPPFYPYGYFAGAAIAFGVGMAVGGAIWGNCNWGGGNIDVSVDHHNNFSRNVNRGDRVNQLKTERGSGTRGDRGSWQHSPEHRKGAQYRDAATQQKFNRASDSARVASRESFRGRAEQGRQELARGGAGQGAARSRESGIGQGGAGAARGRDGGVGSATGGSRGGGQIGGGGGGRAFEGVGQGQSERSYSQRGQSSRGGSSYSGGGSRGGGGGFSGGGGGRGGGGGGRGGGGGGRR